MSWPSIISILSIISVPYLNSEFRSLCKPECDFGQSFFQEKRFTKRVRDDLKIKVHK